MQWFIRPASSGNTVYMQHITSGKDVTVMVAKTRYGELQQGRLCVTLPPTGEIIQAEGKQYHLVKKYSHCRLTLAFNPKISRYLSSLPVSFELVSFGSLSELVASCSELRSVK